MDGSHFDTLARVLSSSTSRRGALRLLVGPALSALLTLGALPSAAKNNKKKKNNKKNNKKKKDDVCPHGQNCPDVAIPQPPPGFVCPDPNEFYCPNFTPPGCCPLGTVCPTAGSAGQCCPPDAPIGCANGSCTRTGFVCCPNNTGSCRDGSPCCGESCCGQGQTCCHSRGTCCPGGYYCCDLGPFCCPNGTVCADCTA